MFVLRQGNVLTVGFEKTLIQRGAVARDASEVLDTYAYFYGVVNANFSIGAAASLFKGVLSLILILAANKIAVMSYHFPWPGYGHVVKNGDGFRYLAEPMMMTL